MARSIHAPPDTPPLALSGTPAAPPASPDPRGRQAVGVRVVTCQGRARSVAPAGPAPGGGGATVSRNPGRAGPDRASAPRHTERPAMKPDAPPSSKATSSTLVKS